MTHSPETLPRSGADVTLLSLAEGQFSLRASDAEREAAADALRDHCTQGRLSPDELSQRLDLVYAARTIAELAPVFADLPAPPANIDRPGARGLLRRTSSLVAVPAGMAVVALATIADAHLLWLAWPLLAVAGRHRRFRRRWVNAGA